MVSSPQMLLSSRPPAFVDRATRTTRRPWEFPPMGGGSARGGIGRACRCRRSSPTSSFVMRFLRWVRGFRSDEDEQDGDRDGVGGRGVTRSVGVIGAELLAVVRSGDAFDLVLPAEVGVVGLDERDSALRRRRARSRGRASMTSGSPSAIGRGPACFEEPAAQTAKKALMATAPGPARGRARRVGLDPCGSERARSTGARRRFGRPSQQAPGKSVAPVGSAHHRRSGAGACG